MLSSLLAKHTDRRIPAWAGKFYPAEAKELAGLVEQCLQNGRTSHGHSPKAVIAPHAGYRYSGPIAGSAFLPWTSEADVIRRIVLIGPSHWLDFRGIALSDADRFATPLGAIEVDQEAIQKLENFPFARRFEAVHDREHCLEVELPFLQRILGRFTIVPLLVSDATDDELRETIEALWDGPETRFVISSDLSHYYPYDQACDIDRDTARFIESLDSQRLDADRACGYRAIRGFMESARAHALHVETVDLRNSADIAGPRDQVVGYGAFVFQD